MNTNYKHFRYPARSFDANGNHIGPGPWLAVIHAVNGLAPDSFGAPESTEPWWAGGDVEEYPEARVIHRGDGTVSIVAKTEAMGNLLFTADDVVMSKAAKTLDTGRTELTVGDALSYIECHGFGVAGEIDALIVAAAETMEKLHPEATLHCLAAMADSHFLHYSCELSVDTSVGRE